MDPFNNLATPQVNVTSSHSVNIPYAVFIPLIILITTGMNLGTIFAFWKLPSLREKPSELLILNLACSDLITGLFVLPLGSPLYITPNQWPLGEIGCAIWILSVDISVHGTLIALMTISLDRFLLVYLEYPQYIRNVTRRRVYRVIACGWIFTVMTGAIEMAYWEKPKSVSDEAGNIDHSMVCLSPPRRVRSFALPFFLILYMLPVIIVCLLSTAFLYQLHLRLRGARRTTASELKESSGGGEKNRDFKQSSDADITLETSAGNMPTKSPNTRTEAIRNRYIKPGITLICLVSAMAICMLPYSFYVIYSDIVAGRDGRDCNNYANCNNLNLIYGLILMQFLNAMLDPFIYVLTRRKVRRFYLTLFGRGSRSSTSL